MNMAGVLIFSIFFLSCILNLGVSGSFENVALNKICDMSSIHSPKEHPPGAAVNGDNGGFFSHTVNCIHTKSDDRTPWWEVNLDRPYPVHSIVVWARTGFEYRIKDCVITVDGEECYRFATTPATRNTTVTCTNGVINGSVVRMSKNSTSLPKQSVTINLCEFEVISCSGDYWGSGCDRRCGNCSNGEVCDKVTGHCPTCPSGLQPPLCITECARGTYGQNCTETCSAGCEDDCDKVSGHCTCKPGWQGPDCQQECPVGNYGLNCRQNCSVHCDVTCDKATGHCTCTKGYTPPLCLTEEKTADKSTNTGVVVGAVVGALCAVVVVVVVVLVIVRLRRSRPRGAKRERMADTVAYVGAAHSTSESPSSGNGGHQAALAATNHSPAHRFPVTADRTNVAQGESGTEPGRESSAPSTHQPYENVDHVPDSTYDRPQVYQNTGDHHVYSDLNA